MARLKNINIHETGKTFNISHFSHLSDTYIETGSCIGESIQRALDAGFKFIHSVEIVKEFYIKCKTRFVEKNNVFVYNGKSVDMLDMMISEAETWNPIVFFLDAHPAGPNTGGHDDLMQNGAKSEFNQHNIITRELEIILSTRGPHTIIIDDVNGNNKEAQQYCRLIQASNPNYKFGFYDADGYKNKVLIASL